MKSGGLLPLVALLTFWAELTVTSGQPDICYFPADPGPCRPAITQFYYNPLVKMCVKFTDGSCSGNKNHFRTLEACQRICEGKPGLCPKPPRDTDTKCDLRCESDWDCPGSHKCCRYGCKIACFPPV